MKRSTFGLFVKMLFVSKKYQLRQVFLAKEIPSQENGVLFARCFRRKIRVRKKEENEWQKKKREKEQENVRIRVAT